MLISSGSTSAEVEAVSASFDATYYILGGIVLWVVLVAWSYIYYRTKLRPAIMKLRETPEGRHQLVKVLFPPRFNRD